MREFISLSGSFLILLCWLLYLVKKVRIKMSEDMIPFLYLAGTVIWNSGLLEDIKKNCNTADDIKKKLNSIYGKGAFDNEGEK